MHASADAAAGSSESVRSTVVQAAPRARPGNEPDSRPATSLRLRFGAATSAGNRRRLNEDALATGDRRCFVADGMGGHAAGEVAAAIALDTITALVDEQPFVDVDGLAVAVTTANDAIRERAGDSGTPGMGTTLVGAVVLDGGEHDPGTVAVIHVGDSRCYRFHEGKLQLVTRDHSLVQELVDAGRLDAEAASRHPMANVVTRSLGTDAHVEADVVLLGASPGRLLLCSDGLSGELLARTIGRVLAGFADPQVAAERLVELTLAGPARDNVTAIVIDVEHRDMSHEGEPTGEPDHRASVAVGGGGNRLDTGDTVEHDVARTGGAVTPSTTPLLA